MFQVLKSWYKSLLSDPNSATFFIIITVLFVIVYFYSHIFMPLLVALGVSYILEVPINFLERKKIMSRGISSLVFMLLFFSFLGFFLVYVVPSLVAQGSDLVNKIPALLTKVSDYIKLKMEQYPNIFAHIDYDAVSGQLMDSITSFSTDFIKKDLLGYLMNITSFLMYLVLIPLLSYFMLKDKHELISGVKGLFPPNLKLAAEMWKKMNKQLMNYISGKFIHICIIFALNFLIFYFCGLNYAVLLGLVVGLSVLIPVVGAAVATAPVLLVAFTQFGIETQLWILLGIYVAGLVLDANVLTPLLFSEKMKLHPFVILAAVLVFGSMWGFWGVFFAIPLATFVKTLYLNWPRGRYIDEDERANGEAVAPAAATEAGSLTDDLDEALAVMQNAKVKLGRLIDSLDRADVSKVSASDETQSVSDNAGVKDGSDGQGEHFGKE